MHNHESLMMVYTASYRILLVLVDSADKSIDV